MIIRCEQCRYCEVSGIHDGDRPAIETARCHRYPPQSVDGPMGVETMYPIVKLDDWCGEGMLEE